MWTSGHYTLNHFDLSAPPRVDVDTYTNTFLFVLYLSVIMNRKRTMSYKPAPFVVKKFKPLAKSEKATVQELCDLKPSDYAFGCGHSFGEFGCSMQKIIPAKYASDKTKTKIPLRLQIGAGDIPFGVQINKFGQSFLNLTITDKAAVDALMKFDSEVKAAARVYDPKYDDSDDYRPILMTGRPKDDDPNDKWDDSVHLKVPVSDTTGEPVAERTRNGQRICRIEEEDGSLCSIHDLTKRRFSKAIFRIDGIYYQKSNFGVMKSLEKLLLAPDPDIVADSQSVEFV